MLNLSILLVTLPVWTAGIILLAIARHRARQRVARLVLATIPLKKKGR